MKHTRRTAAWIAAVLTAVLLTTPAYAHGGCHGRTQARQTAAACYNVCPVEDCTTAGRHTHNGTVYCGYSHGSGICNGVCAALCPVENCAEAGRHTHDGVIYCGYAHESGFCDGTCVAAAQPVVPVQPTVTVQPAVSYGCHSGYGHHGCR